MPEAVIDGSLVDVRNVGTHKVMKLTIHVPEERAMEVIKAFGWPTGVNPVPVAVAKLVGAPSQMPDKSAQPPVNHKVSQQAAMCCKEKRFHKFLNDTCSPVLGHWVEDDESAALAVRIICDVESRAEFDNSQVAAQRWRDLHTDYLAWLHL